MLSIGIDLDKDGLALEFGGDLFENRGHHSTGTARIGIKVHDDGQPRFTPMFLQNPIEFYGQWIADR